MIEIRKPEPQDAEGIADTHLSAWKTTYKEILPSDFLDNLSFADFLARAQGRFKKPELDCFVAIDKEINKVIGFAVFGPCREKNVDADGELYAIYLYQERQGRGVGKLLFKQGFQTLKEKGYKKMMVSVFDQNISSKIFYEKAGGKFYGNDHVILEGVSYPTATYLWELK